MPMSLRPALKACTDNDRTCSSPFPFASSSTISDSPHVHFPPTPTLTSTALTHSPHVYDRAPIKVSPNNCALPNRGDRVYSADDAQAVSPSAMDSYFLPRRTEVMHPLQAWSEEQSLLFRPSQSRYDISPSLVADMSSESEDSDHCGSPTPSGKVPFVSVQLASSATPYPYGGGFARQQSDPAFGGLEDTQLAMGLLTLTSSTRPKIKKQHQEPHNEGDELAREGLLKKGRSRKERLPEGERTRKLSNTRCITSFTSFGHSPEGCLGGF